MTKLWVLMLPFILVACSSAPVVHPPQAIEQAKAADKDARRALRDGDLRQAQRDFSKALALQQSLDDTDASATTLINLATVTHQLNDDAGALAGLDTILLEQQPIYPPPARLSASFRKAVILADLARLGEADSALRSAESLCANGCALGAGIAALRARILLLQGDAEGALVLAQAVSKAGNTSAEERANSLRVAALAEEKLARHADALRDFQAALQADKALALSARIAEDLQGMARVSAQLGHEQQAAEYARRALLVNEAQHRVVP